MEDKKCFFTSVFRMILSFALLAKAFGHFNAHNDDFLFNINWPGTIQDTLPSQSIVDDQSQALNLITGDNEKYKCFIPQNIQGKNKHDDENYTGPSPIELLKPHFVQPTCTYRIESYWTYEMCHGKHLRQYHETKEPGKLKTYTQEFYLGFFTGKPESVAQPDIETMGSTPRENIRPPVIKIDHHDFPYFAINLTDGTVCDITGKQRRAKVMYICLADGRGEIHEIKEVSSCEYEVIIFSKHLCSHPLYKLKTFFVNKIQCHSVDGSPKRPMRLDSLELESAFGRFTAPFQNDFDDNKKQSTSSNSPTNTDNSPIVYHHPVIQDVGNNLLKDFLNGDYCVTGGSGWWTHEFCFGKYVSQYHETKDHKTVIYLGKWDEGNHIMWAKEHIHKLNKLKKGLVVHYYANGDVCDLTGESRNVEVRLKCKEDPERPTSMSILLSEPAACQYILVVESPVICSILDKADEYGLIEKIDD